MRRTTSRRGSRCATGWAASRCSRSAWRRTRPTLSSDATFRRIATLAEELDLPVHVRLHETDGEIAESLGNTGGAARAPGVARAADRAPDHRARGPPHCVRDRSAARAGSSIADARRRTSSSRAALRRWRRCSERLNIGLGTDGAARTTASTCSRDAHGGVAFERRRRKHGGRAGVRHATARHARRRTCPGPDAGIGSIVPGKWADLATVTLGALETQPCYDRSHISSMLSAGARDRRLGGRAAVVAAAR